MKTSAPIFITRFLLIIGFIAASLWLFDKNFPLSGVLVLRETFGNDQPAISSLGPPPRLKIEAATQIILEGPVYFDIRTPRWFNKAEIAIEYREEGRQLIGIGGKVGDPWAFDIKPLSGITDLGDGWKRASVSFDLNPLMSVKNVKRFLLDTVGETGQVLRLRLLIVTLRR